MLRIDQHILAEIWPEDKLTNFILNLLNMIKMMSLLICFVSLCKQRRFVMAISSGKETFTTQSN